jgi:hypothetical protein
MPRKGIHVTKSPAGYWRATKAGGERAFATGRTQAAAEKAAKTFAKKHGGAEVVTHRPNGRIRSSDTIGKKDPNPPRDREH